MILSENKNKNSDSLNLSFPSSHCQSCKKSLKWYCNIPVLSYLFLKAKCIYCEAAISSQYPAVELAAVFVSVLAVLVFGWTLSALCVSVVGWFLICLFFIDAQTQYLPDGLTLPLMWLGLLANSYNLFTSLKSAVYGAALGYVILWVLFYVFKRLTKKDGLGFGDFKLLAALGAWFGWVSVAPILFLSAVLTLLFYLVLRITGKTSSGKPIAFGPAICVVGYIFFYYGQTITQYWLTH